MKQAAKAAHGSRMAPVVIGPDPCEAVRLYGSLHTDLSVLREQLKLTPDADTHGRFRVLLSTVERMRGNLRTLLGESGE